MALVDPYEEFWARAAQADLVPAERKLEAQVQNTGPSLTAIAAGLGASYLLYRHFMSRRMQEEIKRMGKTDLPSLQLMAQALTKGLSVRWHGLMIPLLVAGYVHGVREAKSGDIPQEMLEQIATRYAQQLGDHINNVSMEAMVEGYRAQVNRKVPAARAAERVARAYGVTPRAMNSIVATLTMDDPKRLTSAPVQQFQDSRIAAIITDDTKRRAAAIGESEAWAAKSQAKQIVWMYGMEQGVIPEDAERVWITAKDEKVCKVCGPLHKKKVAIGEKFETKSGDYWSPPTHINCRCDIELDFNVTPDLQGELAALIDAELVHKSQDDPRTDYWDARDTKGRFAPATKTKMADPRFATITVPDVKIDLPDPKPPVGKLEPQKLGSSKLVGKLTPVGKLEPKTRLAEVTSDKLSPSKQRLTPTKFVPEKFIPTKLPSMDKLKASKPSKLNGSKFTEQGAWQELDFPLMALLPYEYAGEDTYLVDDEVVFVPLDDRPERMRGRTSQLGMEVDEFWKEFIQEEMDDYLNQGEDWFYPGPEDVQYTIDHEAYAAALYETVHGVPRAASTLQELWGPNGERLSVSAHEIASYLALETLVDERRPVIVLTTHGLPGVTKPDPDSRISEAWVNPGKWQVVSEYEEHNEVVSHKPYRIVWVEPMD